MTTLPQTTPIRMPRPNGSNTGVALPGVGPVPAMVAGQQGLSLADAWRVIRGHMWLIVVMVCISAVAGFFINGYLERYYSRYTATGLIQFQPTSTYDPVHNPDPRIDYGALALELATQAQMLKHDALLTKVLINPSSEIRQTRWYQQFPSAQAAKIELAKEFTVTPIVNTRLIQVAMTTPIAVDSKTIVTEITQQHIIDQKELATEKMRLRTSMLAQRLKAIDSKKQERQLEIREKSVRLQQAGWDVNGGANSKRAEEAQLSTTQSNIAATINNLQTRLDSTLAQINRGEDPVELTNYVEGDPTIAMYRNQIDSIDMALSMNASAPNNPSTVRMTATRDIYVKKLAEARGEKSADYRKTMVDGLTNSIAADKAQFQAVSAQLEKVKQEIADLSNVYRQFLVAKDEEFALRSESHDLQEQIDQINQFGNLENSGVTWSTRPTTPEAPSFPKMSATMTMSILAGLSMALAIAFLRELTNTTVRSPRDITRIGQLNLLGMVSDINDDAQSAGAKLPLVIFEAPHAILAEQFRQVRTRMQHAASLDSTRSILITSPGAGDGKSTVACNLAAGLALNGRRILLVDANFRRPELHKIFNLTNEAGFSDALNQLDTLPQNIHESQVPNLAILTSGPKPVNATELFESQLLVDFIEKALEEFDHVVFDSGPLLVVSETVALAPRVDGVVTVVRARHNSRGLLVRMRDTLRQLKAEHLGVLLNGVRAQGGGYYGRNIKAYYAYMDDGTVSQPIPVETTPAA